LDTAPWERVLSLHAKADGFDYAGLRADEAGMADLARFVESVGAMDPEEPLASWLNAYNALVIHAIVTRPPVPSVRGVDGFFDTLRYRVAGRRRTLDDVENRVIRPRFRDARIHFALNCGARGCPVLHRHAFTTATLDATLDRLCRRALASQRHARIRDGVVHVSELFFWFAADFERDAGSVVAWLARYGGERLAALSADARLERIPYDWRLNQTTR
jgi:hypothetical protein